MKCTAQFLTNWRAALAFSSDHNPLAPAGRNPGTAMLELYKQWRAAMAALNVEIHETWNGPINLFADIGKVDGIPAIGGV